MISLAMIVKPADEEAAGLKRCLESVHEHVDEICITVTGENRKVEAVAREYDANISYTEWNDDFSEARNFNFSQCNGDWILWLDADDTLRKAENLKKLVAHAEQNNIDAYAFQYQYDHNDAGQCIDLHWKVQLLKNDGHFEWKGAVHEDPIQKRTNARWVKTKDCVRIHHSSDERTEESYERNLRILKKEREENPDEPRTLFYLGRTYAASGDLQKAVEALDEYLTKSGWDEERYEARLLMGQCYMLSGELDEALAIYNEAILEKETYPDAYIKKGMVYLRKEDWEKALTNFQLSLQQDMPEANTYFNPMLYTRDVYSGAAAAYLQLGKLEEAQKVIDKALEYDKTHDYSQQLKQTIEQVKRKNDVADSFIDIARYLEDKPHSIQQLLRAVPPTLADDPRILTVQRKFGEQKQWPDKSIAVVCGNTTEAWTPESQNDGGIGGSETAVIELTDRLTEMGWDVTVYNRCNANPQGEEYDGVTYKNYWTFDPKDEFDVLWVWRTPELLDYDLEARKIVLDLHDTMSPHDLTDDRVEKADEIFVKTDYHRSLYPQVDDEKFTIVGNGISLDRFDKDVEREPLRFIYSSTPNRGLDIILENIWPEIIDEHPDAELHVYYGWNTFYELEKDNPERMQWMKKVQSMMEQDGVVDHGRVGQDELAEDMLKSNFWLYPTHFPEIHCITACEMQAAGVIPITSGYAALKETQKAGVQLEGDVFDPEWQEEFTQEVLDLIEDEERQQEIRENAQEAAQEFSWDQVSEIWNNKLQ